MAGKAGRNFLTLGVICIVIDEIIRLLVIDDDIVDRSFIVRQLTAAKIAAEICEADSIMKSKELAKGLEFDCIIVDYRLPDGDGIAFIKFLQDENILTPVILLTGQGDEMVAVEAMKAGAADYLVKGNIKPEILLQVIYASVRLRKAQLEAQIAQKRAMQAEKTAFLGTMIAGVAHEITQPLNAIKLAAGVMLYRYRKGEEIPQEKIRDTFATIEARCERIEGIINDVRTFVRCGYAPPHVPCDVIRAVENVLDMLNDKINGCGITIHNCLPVRLPSVLGDMQMLEIIITNIVTNAIHALEDSEGRDKKIYIEAAVDKWVQLQISDTGTGIEAALSEKIFEPFFSTKNSGRGMGLGLAIVYSAIMALGGEISCKNNAFGGATFQICLPACHDEMHS